MNAPILTEIDVTTWASGGMADAADLKSAGETHEGSTPSSPTIKIERGIRAC